MAEALNNFVWDQISLAHDLRVVCVDDDPEAAKFRVSFDVVLDRESYQTLTGIARNRNRGIPVTLLKRIVRHGLKLFFSDEENENDIAA
jgi:hypothetical protein